MRPPRSGRRTPAFATKAFAALLIVAMSVLNSFGSQAVARVQSVVVVVVIGILSLFAVATLANADFTLLAPADYPPLGDIVGSVALTFFAFLGFGVITFTAAQLVDPPRQLPRAVYLALGIATVIYVAVALGVFGTLTVQEVIDSGGTALAVAAEPVLGQAGYWLMTVTALFATAGATNAGLYPAAGLSEHLASIGQFPPLLARRFGGRAPGRARRDGRHRDRPGRRLRPQRDRLDRERGGAHDLHAHRRSATFGSADETGASALILVLGILAAAVVLLLFIPTLLEEPATITALVVILVVSLVLDLIWKRVAGRRAVRAESLRGLEDLPRDRSRRPAGR